MVYKTPVQSLHVTVVLIALLAIVVGANYANITDRCRCQHLVLRLGPKSQPALSIVAELEHSPSPHMVAGGG